MKRNIPAFLSGALTTALVGTIAVSALAASGRMTIEVDPVNVQVNGQVFVPTDANGKEVPVFAYNGTTYAPLRALAEAYGLEVGYDATSNMATVGKTDVKPEADLEPTPAPDTTAKVDYSDWSAEDEAAYQEFKGLWEIELTDSGDRKGTVIGDYEYINWETYTLKTNMTWSEVNDVLLNAAYSDFRQRLASELREGREIELINFYISCVTYSGPKLDKIENFEYYWGCETF